MNPPSNDLTALAQRIWASFLGRCVHRFLAMDGIDRCLVLSSQAFTALIPLLILVSTVAPPGEPDVVASTIIAKFGLTGDGADAVRQLFEIPDTAASGVSVASAILLVYSGVSFTRRLQKMYLAAWHRERTGVRGNVFAALGLVVLVAEVMVLYAVTGLVRGLPFDWLLLIPISIITGFVPWTSVPYLLMNRDVHWRRLVVSGGLAAVCMAIFGTATTIYMPDLMDQYTHDFGLFGVTIAIIGWLLAGTGFIVASTSVGAEFDQSTAPWVVRLKIRFHLFDPALGVPETTADGRASGLNSDDLVLLARVLANWLVMAGAVWVATWLVPGIEVHGGLFTYLWLSVLLGLVNAVIGPVLSILVINLTVVRLGLLALIVNGVLLALTAGLSRDLEVGGVASAVLGALVITTALTLRELVVRPFKRDALTRSG